MLRSLRPVTAHITRSFYRNRRPLYRIGWSRCLSIVDSSSKEHSTKVKCSNNNWAASGKYSLRHLNSTRALAKEQDEVSITFIDRDGDRTTVVARVGDSLLDVAKDNDIDLEGACEGTLACSTCHLIFDPKQFEEVPLDPPSEEELDMLDLAYGLTDTSRLGCQIVVTKELDGLVLTVPAGTSDARMM